MLCTIQANPAVKQNDWSWMHNGKVIGYGDSLTLLDLTTWDSGIYECLAQNDAGLKKNKTDIEVACKSGYFYLYFVFTSLTTIVSIFVIWNNKYQN